MGKTINTKVLCTDMDLTLNEQGPQNGKTYKGKLTYYDEDHSKFVEDAPKEKQPFPERRYRDLVGSLHGKVSMNANGVTLHMYVRHSDYANACALCDILEQEVEQMTNELSSMNLQAEAQQCGK